jgi:acylphosphatase
MNRRRVQVFYSGRVQGVGFRHQVRRLAAGFQVTGMVRNLPDSRVELVAEGCEAELAAFCESIRASYLGSLIRAEEIFRFEPTGDFAGFEIGR